MSLANLEKREKNLLIVGAVVAVIFVSFFALRGCGGSRSGGADLGRTKKNFETFRSDLARYRELKQTVQRIDERLAATPADFDLVGTLSAIVDELGLRPSIRNLNPGQSGSGQFFSESYVDLDMQAITLTDLVSLLRKIKGSSAFVRVSQLSVKKRMGDDATLDVNIRVAAYSAKTEEPE